ncbi:phosphopantetheine-binding protein [Nonomuraea sp. NPDC050536]|uniref:phosphopantetheine-binding protein n=1 Tax=Nonomuraea sp. NPDC050536 TaxID=3364366 RepID=UPI0037C80712
MFELGFTSYSVIEANEGIKRDFRIELPLRRLYEDLTTVQSLAKHIAAEKQEVGAE